MFDHLCHPCRKDVKSTMKRHAHCAKEQDEDMRDSTRTSWTTQCNLRIHIYVSRQSFTGSLNTSKCNICYDDEGDSCMKIQIEQKAQGIFHLQLFHLYKYPFALWSLIFFIDIKGSVSLKGCSCNAHIFPFAL